MDAKEYRAKAVIEEAQKLADESGEPVEVILNSYILYELNHLTDELKSIRMNQQQTMVQMDRENSDILLAMGSDHDDA